MLCLRSKIAITVSSLWRHTKTLAASCCQDYKADLDKRWTLTSGILLDITTWTLAYQSRGRLQRFCSFSTNRYSIKSRQVNSKTDLNMVTSHIWGMRKSQEGPSFGHLTFNCQRSVSLNSISCTLSQIGQLGRKKRTLKNWLGCLDGSIKNGTRWLRKEVHWQHSSSTQEAWLKHLEPSPTRSLSRLTNYFSS